MASVDRYPDVAVIDGEEPSGTPQFRIGRYELFDRIAAGGMATVYFGRVVGGAGFRRAVALKRLHPHLAKEKTFVSMLRDEARLASRIRHRSVVPVLDVVEAEGELLLVLELVEGPSLGAVLTKLRESGELMPLPIVSGILRAVLSGLAEAHVAKDELGVSLELVHRDVSPQNVIIGVDGIARVLDFGIAKARGRIHTTDDGKLKGNFAYMAPEQAKRKAITARADLYAVGILFWECVTGRRMHPDDDAAAILTRVLYEEPPIPSDYRDLAPEVDAFLKKSLAREPEGRFASASEMSDAIGKVLGTAGPDDVARYLRTHMAEELVLIRARIERVENAAPMSEGGDVRAKLASLSGGSLVPQQGSGSESPPRVTTVAHDVPVPAPPARGRSWMVPAAALGIAVFSGAFAASRRETDFSTATSSKVAPTIAPASAARAPSPVEPAHEAPLASASSASSASTVAPAASSTSATSSAPAVPSQKPRPQVGKARPSRPAPVSKPTPPTPSEGPTTSPTPGQTQTGLEGIPRDRE